MLTIDKPGCYSISHDSYHADPCIEPSLSRGVIHQLLTETPAHAWQNHPRLNKNLQPVNDKKFDVGQAAHGLLLEGIDNVSVISAENWMTKAAKEARDEAYATGKTPLLTKDYIVVLAMVEAAKKALKESEFAIEDLQEEGVSEMSYFWQENGIWCRTRSDWVNNQRNLIIDFKTTGMLAHPGTFGKRIADGGYDIQDALYRLGVKEVDGKDARFVFLVQEDDPPFLCSLISLTPQFQAMGEEKVRCGIALWKHCMETGEWPGYPTRTCHIDPPPYALTNWESRRFDLEVNYQQEAI